jgi:hypothetical protein
MLYTGTKLLTFAKNTYRIAADAVPCFEYRRYFDDGSRWTGVAFLPDRGGKIVNWPEQNYENGVARNTATGQRFKDTVRILKRLRYKMNDDAISAAAPIPSFLIECLVWNLSDATLGLTTYSDVLRDAFIYLYDRTASADACKEWVEVNKRKYLFGNGQPWTVEQVHSFVLAAWSYLGFK